MYHSSSMTNKTPSGVKMHHESTEPESCQTAKIGFLPSGGLLQSCVTLSQFSHKTAAFTLSSAWPIAFSQLWTLMRCLKPPTQELWLHLQCHFLCTHVHKALSNEKQKHSLTQEIWSVACMGSPTDKCHKLHGYTGAYTSQVFNSCCWKNDLNKI